MVGMHDATVIQAVDPQFPERAAGLQRRDLLSEHLADREIVPQMGMDRFQRLQQVLSRFPGLRMISGLLCHTCLSCAAARRAATRSRTRGATSPMKVRSAWMNGGKSFICFHLVSFRERRTGLAQCSDEGTSSLDAPPAPVLSPSADVADGVHSNAQ